MLKKIVWISAVWISLMNCKKENSSKIIPIQNTVKPNITEGQDQKKPDDSAIETVKTFLAWYRDNEEKINSFNTIKGGGIAETEKAVNYSVDFDQVEKEIKFLKNTDLFSTKFLTIYQKRYQEGDEYFRQTPANDGPPDNFDYNYFFLTQENFESDLKNITHIKFTVKPVNAQLCYVEFHLEHCGMTLRYTLVKKDQWLIDSIENIS